MSRRQQDDARDRVAHLLRTEGIEAAYGALIAVCRDPKASSQARSHAASTLFRAADFIAKDTDEEKELHEMTPAELNAAVRKARRMLARTVAADGELDSAGGVFG
jgi:hypothetical protein